MIGITPNRSAWNLGGAASCVIASVGWFLVVRWFQTDGGRELLWWALGTFAIGTIVAWFGWYFGHGFANRLLPVLGMVVNIVGVVVVVVLLLTGNGEDDDRRSSSRSNRRSINRARFRTKRRKRRRRTR